MSKYVIEDTTLISIADAVREKSGTTDLIKVSELPDAIAAITTGGGGEITPLELTGDCSYTCGGAIAGNYIKDFGNTITTKDVSNASYMFHYYANESVPFAINALSTQPVSADSMFYSSKKLKTLPKINNLRIKSMQYMFYNCHNLRTIPEDFADTWDWSSLHNASSGGYLVQVFNNCYSLRSIPQKLLKELWNSATSATYVMKIQFNYCHVLDEIDGLPFNTSVNWTSNVFNTTFDQCNRLKKLTFATNEDGTPKTANWKSQTINLTANVGYAIAYSYIVNYNSGITTDKQVTDDVTYQALKNDPDWYTCDVAYSRYNHDSAVETINSLPDTSAYGTNTIRFKGTSGSKTDGGAINTLTAEEIAVAAAKGWTVTLS